MNSFVQESNKEVTKGVPLCKNVRKIGDLPIHHQVASTSIRRCFKVVFPSVNSSLNTLKL